MEIEPKHLGIAGIVVILIASVVYLNMGSGASKKTEGGANNTKKKTTAEDASKLEKKYPAGPMKVFFGSQTGTAEGFARTIMEEGKQKGFDAQTVDLEDFDPASLAEVTNAVFLMATYGEGEPTDNSAKFHAWLRDDAKAIESGFLNKTNFTVFGLGNRQYEHYNKMGKLTNELLEKHGGRRVYVYGEGDDDGTLEEDFDKWREGLWPVMVAVFHPEAALADSINGDSMESTRSRTRTASIVELDFRTTTVPASEVPAILASRRYELGESTKGASVKGSSSGGLKINSSTKYYFTAPECEVICNRELRSPEDGGSTRHVEIDLSSSGLTYHTADNLAVLPENSDEVVEAICSSQGYNADEYFILESGDGAESKFKHMFPTPCTIGDALRRYCDVQGIPRHSAVSALIPYVTDEAQRAWVERITEKANRPMFKVSIEEAGRSLCDLLAAGGELSSCKIPLADFLSMVPRLQPRYYTISSSSALHPTAVHITVALTEKHLPGGRKFRGVCSSDLQTRVPKKSSGKSKKSAPAAAKSTVRVFVRPSTFRLPASLDVPIVMIGPGTGIAPMRALLQDRKWQFDQLSASAKKQKKPRNILYFGCKSRAQDYIYADELQALQDGGVLTELHVAFSREQKQKVYVQHLIKRPGDADSITSLLSDHGAYLYVCGATAMGNDVHEALVTIFQDKKGMTSEAATAFLKDLQHGGRYVQELWSA